ncbi:hypothetical protein GCM10019059_00190 [Camelimonas fluminis]|nr:hypothetical protein GCM10019059_00190 [Camelimonas fluminis]
MRPVLAEMGGLHHGAQRGFDRALRIGEEVGDTGERLFRLGVEDMEDRADQKRMAGFFPMVPLVQAAFGIDQNIGDVLHVAHFPLAAPHLEQGIVGRGLWISRIEEEHAAVVRTETGCQRPVLALDVVDDRRARPGQ